MNDNLMDVCRVCGSRAIAYLCDTRNEHSETKTLSNFRCETCGSVFVGNIVSGEELGNAYSCLNTRAYYEEIHAENLNKMAEAVQRLKNFVSAERRIIDIGTGNGQFVELLKKSGFQHVSAHEIEGSCLTKIESIADAIYQDFDYSTIPSGAFDLATLLDVAEHVPDPAHLFHTCARILADGGMLYLHTPVVTKTDRLMHRLLKIPVLRKSGSIWQRGRTSIFHLENYTPKSLTLLLEKAGFTNITIEVKNELSWPVTRYVRVYLLDKQGLPRWLAPLLAPLAHPFLATDAFNANKAIVRAEKAPRPAAAQPAKR
ncbi:MAG TPA: class I SAM-dependent methyltransferase [Candidatus Hydrogenedentes bacterium]|nr:class I SAM-dependent methyltransferase [Candidatus Hydrogenedentota bacterium]